MSFKSRLKELEGGISLNLVQSLFVVSDFAGKTKKPKTHPNTKLLPIFNGRNKKTKTPPNTKFLPLFKGQNNKARNFEKRLKEADVESEDRRHMIMITQVHRVK